MKKLISLILALGMALSLAACGGSGSSAGSTAPADSGGSDAGAQSGKQIVLKFACDDTTTSSYYIALEEFKKEVEEKSNGSIAVELYGDAALGNATDTIEGMQLGTIECVFASTAAVSAFVPEFYYVDAPFIFRDADHAHAVVDGEVGNTIAEACLNQQGIRILGWYDTGFRNIYTTKAIRSISDLKGLKIRTMQSDLHTATFEALGCLPTPMSSSEVYTSLSQGTIDAAENCYSYVVNQSMYEVCPYIINTGHFFGFCVIMISDSVYQAMTPEQQEIVTAAATNSVTFQRDLMEQQNTDAVSTLKDKGIEFIDLNRDELKEAVQSVYSSYSDKLDPAVMKTIEDTKG
ncbi:TRAP transporter substrate-binding protein [Oscillibacter sp.]|uniref:TRAP transporter substrate-binding protein n=1 Tax=Oscillibacter sp. TaxID=1945593 RepID=UPI002607FC08|nr:TRAP transporter substrate-binding protein [Oscillibacter sp.]MDD3347167.1 TRAP transporter substrate-binding protein [Oscillibacter sp.]